MTTIKLQLKYLKNNVIYSNRFKDGNEITIDNDKYFVDYMENGMIHFEVRNVTNADIGKYRCHASNIYGYDNSIAQLNLESKNMIDHVISMINKLCFATKSPRPFGSDRNRHELDAMSNHGNGQSISLVEPNVRYRATIATLASICLVSFTLHSLLDGSGNSFAQCEDTLQNIREYVFKCNQCLKP